MPPVRISDDGVSVTFMLDDGSTRTVPKETADRLAPGPVTSPGGAAGPPPQDLGSPDAVSGTGTPPVAPVSGGFVAPRLPGPPIGQPDAVSGAAGPLVSPVAPSAAAPLAPPPQSAIPAEPEPDVTLQAPRIAQPRAQQPSAAAQQPANPFVASNELGASSFDRQRGAIGEKATAEQQAADDRLAAQQDYDARAAAIEVERQKQQAADMAERQKLEREHQDAVKAYGNFKIDENQAWREMGGARQFGIFLGAALAALGAGIAGRFEKNPVLDQLYSKMEQNVRAQMAQRDALGQTAQMKATAADRFGRIASDRGAEFELRMAGEGERLKRRMQVISDKTSSETVKANYDQAIAEVDQRQAANLAAAGDAEWERRYKMRQLNEQAASRADSRALGWAQLEEQRRNNDLDFMARQDAAAAKAAELRAAGQEKEAVALEKQAKEERELGVNSPITGDRLLDPEGQKLMDQAKAYEAAAATNPAYAGFAEAARKKAKDYTFKARTAEFAQKANDALAAGENYARVVDEMIDLRSDAGWESDALKSERWQQLQANWGELVLQKKVAAGLGVISKSDMLLVGKALGTRDPTEWRDIIPGLRKGRENAVAGVRTTLKAAGYRGNYDIPENTALAARERGEGPTVTPSEKAYAAALGPEGFVSAAEGKETARALSVGAARPAARDDFFTKALAPTQEAQQKAAARSSREMLKLGGKLPKSPAEEREYLAAADAGKPPVTDEQRRYIEGFAAAARKAPTEAQRAEARRLLQKAAQQTSHPRLGALATDLLQAVGP